MENMNTDVRVERVKSSHARQATLSVSPSSSIESSVIICCSLVFLSVSEQNHSSPKLPSSQFLNRANIHTAIEELIFCVL